MNDALLNRYLDFLSTKGEKFVVLNNNIYISYSKMVVPMGPIVNDYSINKHQAKELLKQLGGILVRWTNGDISRENKHWYAVACNEFVPHEKLISKRKSEIKRGLKNCEVKRIDANYLSKMGYEIYYKAFKSYKRINILVHTKSHFKNEVLHARNFDDIIHYWGVFYDNKLIAFSSNYVYDKVESSYSSIKIDPEYLNLYPSYALIYMMNKFYLHDNNFEYVNDGFRSILHETNIQDFLIRKFNFKKFYLNLNICYAPLAGMIVNALYPLRNIIKKYDRRLNAIMELESIRRNCNE